MNTIFALILLAIPAWSEAPRHLADYDAELRQPDGRVDIDAMIRRLEELGVTTYYWLIWHAPTDYRTRHGEPATPAAVAQLLRVSLQAYRDGTCDGVVTYCLDKRPEIPTFPLVREAFGEYRGAK